MKYARKIFLIVGIVLPFVIALLFAQYSQNIFDWWKLRNYSPSPQIVSLAETSSFSEKGRNLFYVHDPALLDKTEFQQSCTVGEVTIVLGCYLSKQRIFVYDVQEERLAGVEQVTAVHEMLHAAYDRLPPKEKNRINILLQEAYDRTENERILSTIATYRNKDPSVVPNELHSILGSEVRDLPADLEEYYSQYFIDRTVVVGLAEKYASEFEKREAQIAAYDAQLSQLNGEITRTEAELKEQNVSLQSERATIESLDPRIDDYNSRVTRYNTRVKAYNTKVASVTELVDTYNRIVEERNAIAFEERQLVEAIDTRAIEL